MRATVESVLNLLRKCGPDDLRLTPLNGEPTITFPPYVFNVPEEEMGRDMLCDYWDWYLCSGDD